jgi:Na+/glutamate symporter
MRLRKQAGIAAATAGLVLGVLAGPALGQSGQEQEQRQSCAIISGLMDSGPCPESEQSAEQSGTGTSNQAQEQQQRQCFICIP